MAITNFGGDEVLYGYDESKIIIVPVPYDATSSYIRGQTRVRQPSWKLFALEFYDIEMALKHTGRAFIQ
jgi:hypothetical protein